MTKIRIISLDLDGTLYRDDKTISDDNLSALREAVNLGITLVPNTGRVYRRLSKEFFRIPGLRYVIMSNGASILDLTTGNYLYYDPMPIEKVRQLFVDFKNFDLMPEVSVEGQVFVEERFAKPDTLLEYGIPASYLNAVLPTNKPVPSLADFVKKDLRVEKVNALFRSQEERLRAWNYFSKDPSLKVTSSIPFNLEINASTANKGHGLAVLAKMLGISRDEIMACGDGLNDLDMVRFAGIGVAMKNACEKVRAAADVIVPSNEQDGVAAAIHKFCLRDEPPY